MAGPSLPTPAGAPAVKDAKKGKKQKKFEQLVDSIQNKPLPDKLRVYRERGIPCMLLGPPGVGKSSAVVAIKEDDDWFYEGRPSQWDPVDARGLPGYERAIQNAESRINLLQHKLQLAKSQPQIFLPNPEDLAGGVSLEDATKDLIASIEAEIRGIYAATEARISSGDVLRVSWARPDFLPPVGFDGKGILFLDELNTAPIAVQNVLLQPFQATPGYPRMIGSHIIPAGIWLVAAGNRDTDGAHVNPLSMPFRGRVAMLTVEPNLQDWMDWAVENGVHKHVISFLNFRKARLYEEPASEYSGYPSPRSWSEQVSSLLHAGYAGLEVFKPSIGEAASAEFMGFLKNMEHMPDIDAALAGKVSIDVKGLPLGVRYAVMVEMVFRVQEDPKLMGAAMNIVKQAEPEHGAIFVATMVRHKDPKVKVAALGNSKVRDWSTEHGMLMRPEARK